MEALLCREDAGSDEWRLEVQIVESEFLKRLDAFDAAQAAFEASLNDEEELMKDIERSAAFRDTFTGLRARFPQLLSAFSHLPLADTYSDDQDQQIRVDILVGQDQYWDLPRWHQERIQENSKGKIMN
ncbi:hypothetical protein FJT64_002803 [Amphibalanus amphitrite]|uniref:Uncharacterized protein n=1 Tax=Amphibalanus amphitrite TaxID=1232801 RepID=A0A6A4WDQ7_AMPAM|nr:hypothetical protein FJT64_002803 [Amphibalanus amphitrite]